MRAMRVLGFVAILAVSGAGGCEDDTGSSGGGYDPGPEEACEPSLCDDGDACTVDTCGADGQCRSERRPGCCEDPGDCNGGAEDGPYDCRDSVCVAKVGCADIARERLYAGGDMAGCARGVPWEGADALCAAGWHVCTYSEYRDRLLGDDAFGYWIRGMCHAVWQYYAVDWSAPECRDDSGRDADGGQCHAAGCQTWYWITCTARNAEDCTWCVDLDDLDDARRANVDRDDCYRTTGMCDAWSSCGWESCVRMEGQAVANTSLPGVLARPATWCDFTWPSCTTDADRDGYTGQPSRDWGDRELPFSDSHLGCGSLGTVQSGAMCCR